MKKKEEHMKLTAFPPIVGQSCKILILGSMPSEQSLAKHQYYGNPRNGFWPILLDVFGADPSLDYEHRCRLIVDHKLALWDVLRSCRREGSLDSAIMDAEVNDFQLFFSRCPTIETVCFNGGKAYELYKRHIGLNREGIRYIKLPSTSPAYTLSFDKKKALWREALAQK